MMAALKGWFLLMCVLLGTVSFGQVTITSSLPAPTFLLYERIPLTMEVTNESGAPITLTETDLNNQVVLRVRDTDNRVIPRTDVPLLTEPWVIPDGESDSKTFDLVLLFQIRSERSFRGLQHVVVDGETYSGPALKFNITNGKLFDELKRRREDRIFSLIGVTRGQGDELMLRVTNNDKSMTFATYFLERHLRFYPPHLKVSKDGKVGTLHYLSPSQAVLCLFESDGTPIRREYYQVSPGVPVRLHVQAEQGFLVEGGTAVPDEG